MLGNHKGTKTRRGPLVSLCLCGSCPFPDLTLKRVLERELQNSRAQCRSNDTEQLIVYSSVRVSRPEAVRHIVGFSPDLHALGFLYYETARESDIERPGRRPEHRSRFHIAERADCRLCERCPIEPCSIRPSRRIAIRSAEHLICRLAAWSRSIASGIGVRSGGDREVRTAADAINRSKLPVRSNPSQLLIRKSRHASDACQIQD